MNPIDIDIKILNDKYEIFINKILYKSQIKNITTYIGKDITPFSLKNGTDG